MKLEFESGLKTTFTFTYTSAFTFTGCSGIDCYVCTHQSSGGPIDEACRDASWTQGAARIATGCAYCSKLVHTYELGDLGKYRHFSTYLCCAFYLVVLICMHVVYPFLSYFTDFMFTDLIFTY